MQAKTAKLIPFLYLFIPVFISRDSRVPRRISRDFKGAGMFLKIVFLIIFY